MQIFTSRMISLCYGCLEAGARTGAPVVTTLMNYTRSKTIFQRKSKSCVEGLNLLSSAWLMRYHCERIDCWRNGQQVPLVQSSGRHSELYRAIGDFDLSRRYTRLRDALPCQKPKDCVVSGALSVNRNLENLVLSATYLETPLSRLC